MKCINHSEIEATTICVNCSSPICRSCTVNVKGKNYCQICINKGFVINEQERPFKLAIGSILMIIAGIIGFMGGMVLIFLGSLGGGCCEDVPGYGRSVGLGAIMVVLGLIAIVCSRSARDGEYFGVALAGGICAVLCFPPLGIPALILISTSKKEFI